jgi:CRISPR system Cascade subunit CasE
VSEGDFLRFSLVANPSKKVALEGRRNSARVELYREADQIDWLRRQGERRGFTLPGLAAGMEAGQAAFPQDADRLGRADIPEVQVQRLDTLEGSRTRGDHRLTVVPVRFDGVLRVTDAAAFRVGLAEGFGPAKAFGCGLMLVGRAG